MKKKIIFAALFWLPGILTPLHARDIDSASNPDVQPASPTLLDGYRLAWSDEFDGTSIDETKWMFREGDDTRSFVRSYQTADNNVVSDGIYRCLLKKERKGTKAYTAGGIISRARFRYGYYEARLKVPASRGWHTSFWMMPVDEITPRIELDVVENDSIHLNEYSVNVHRHLPKPHLRFGKKVVHTPDLSADFHTFGCEYTPTVVRYFFDGKLVQEVDATQFEHGDMNIWLTSLGLVFKGHDPIDDTQLPTEAQFDYVRFFAREPEK